MVSSTPRPHFTPGKDLVPILQEAGWAPGPVLTGGRSRPHRDSIPDLPARSSVAIPTELPSSQLYYVNFINEHNHPLMLSHSGSETDGSSQDGRSEDRFLHICNGKIGRVFVGSLF